MGKIKGKLIVVGLGFLIGIPVVASTLGIEVVQGPKDAVCFAVAVEAPAPTAIAE